MQLDQLRPQQHRLAHRLDRLMALTELEQGEALILIRRDVIGFQLQRLLAARQCFSILRLGVAARPLLLLALGVQIKGEEVVRLRLLRFLTDRRTEIALRVFQPA